MVLKETLKKYHDLKIVNLFQGIKNTKFTCNIFKLWWYV